MAHIVTKLQMTCGDTSKVCGQENISNSLPIKEEVNRSGLSAQSGSMATQPVAQPAAHTYPNQFQFPGRQNFSNLRNFGIAPPNLMFQGYSNTSDHRYMLGAPNSLGQVVYAMPSIQQFPGHPTVPSGTLLTPSSNLAYHAAIQTQIQNMYAMPSTTLSGPISDLSMGNYSFQTPPYNEHAQGHSYFLQMTQYPLPSQIYFRNQTVGMPSMRGALPLSPPKNFEHLHGSSNPIQNRYKSPGKLTDIHLHK